MLLFKLVGYETNAVATTWCDISEDIGFMIFDLDWRSLSVLLCLKSRRWRVRFS